MGVRGVQHVESNLGLWVLLLVLCSVPVVLSSRPHLDAAAQQQLRSVSSRSLQQQEAASVQGHQRQLQQNALCPEGCVNDMCIQDSTIGGLRCQKCESNLMINTTDGTCSCPPGRFSLGDTKDCTDCTKGNWCPGGKYMAASPPPQIACPVGMSTLGRRATSARSCVNLPGYSYSITAAGTPSAAPCGPDSYSPGYKKQRACVPCPTGFTTAGAVQAKSPTACVVPAGYFLKGPGQVAPCPKGEWKSGTGTEGNCTRCAQGVTTEAMAAISEASCNTVVQGYYAKAMSGAVITEVAVCPQTYYCQGGKPLMSFDVTNPSLLPSIDTTIKRCPSGTWTENVGATDVLQCLTPPGHKTVGGATVPCGDNEFRADWKPPAEADMCNSCGTGVKMLKSDRLQVFNLLDSSNSTHIPIATSADDCYIQPGQGLMYMTLDKTWRAVNCDSNSTYGVTNTTFGLTPAPCRACPANMVTSKDKVKFPRSSRWYTQNPDGSGGFVSPGACVTQAGYGYDSRGSQKCDKGYYNDKDSYAKCKPCGYALTTRAPGAAATAADCGIEPGYGFGTTHYFNRTLIKCPVGFYNPIIQYNQSTPCTECPVGTTSSVEGSDDVADCNLCLPGWGGDKCATQCGGTGRNASYGPVGRAYGSPCISCNDALTYFSYNWGQNNDVWSAPVTSRIGADNPAECLAAYTQTVDGAFYLPLTGLASVVTTQNVTTFSDCVALCVDGCQFVTYDYKTKDCFTRVPDAAIYEDAPWLAFKTYQAGAGSASAASVNGTVKAKTVNYGTYVWWKDPNAGLVGKQIVPPNVMTFTRFQQCVEACDNDWKCAAVFMESKVQIDQSTGYNTDGPKSCRLIHGETSPGTFKRTVIKSDTNRTAIPEYQKVCRMEPPPVFHGRWPVDGEPDNCRGMPVGGRCLAHCDCDPDECYALAGCPTAICQEDGTWTKPVPEMCFLAIPAQPSAVSCPTPVRPGILPAASGRRLLWDPPATTATNFTSYWVQADKAYCANESLAGGFPPWYFVGEGGFGQLVTDSGVCNRNFLNGNSWVTGIAAQDFGKGRDNWARTKYEKQAKYLHESYVWSYWDSPQLPDPPGLDPVDFDPWAMNRIKLQGMQLVVVGNVGTDHPCQAECSLTAIEVAFYEADNLDHNPSTLQPNFEMGRDPGQSLWEATIHLDSARTMKWSANVTSVINFDLIAEQGPVLGFYEYRAIQGYWVRIKLIAPFNGTDGSGLGRCYAYVGMRDTPANSLGIPARWQEAGAYGTNCTPIDEGAFPLTSQTIGNCTNGGGPGETDVDTCSAAVTSNTCAQVKYGPDQPRSCPFGGQDILYSLYSFNDNGAGPGHGSRRRR